MIAHAGATFITLADTPTNVIGKLQVSAVCPSFAVTAASVHLPAKRLLQPFSLYS